MNYLTENMQPTTSGNYELSQIRANIISGVCKIIPKIGRSKVWEIFGEVEIDGVVTKNVVACKLCNNAYKFNGTSSLMKHKCMQATVPRSTEKLDVDQHTKHQVCEAVTQWTINNCRPFKIVKDDGLLKYTELVLSIGAKYGTKVDVEKMLPHPTTVSRNIDKLYDEAYDLLRLDMSSISKSGFSLTADIWTDNYAKISYLTVTIHFIRNAKINSKMLGFKSMNFESCTKEKILHKVTKILDNFSCRLENGIIVTDRGANMKAAFAECKHIFCFDHLLNNIVEKAISEIDDINDLCKKCTKLVTYFKKSGCNAQLETTLKSFSPTRWNTIYYLLQSVHQNWSQIEVILQNKTQLHRMSGINLSLMSSTIKILKTFAETSKELEGDTYPTLHLAIIHFHFLKRSCEHVSTDDPQPIKNFKNKLNVLLTDVVARNLTIYHKVAVFLFPPTNKMLQFSCYEKEEVRTFCRDMMSKFTSAPAPSQDSSLVPLSGKKQQIFEGFLQSPVQTNVHDGIERELSAYESAHEILYDGFDALMWWEANKHRFPLLYQLSCNILATPASSAASERVFSSARNLLSEKRCVIGWHPASVEKLMFLHYNMRAVVIDSV